jgi:hypothetical protein
MSKHSRTKLVPQSVSPPEKQSLEVIEALPEQNEDPVITELDNEVECPRCSDIMELNSKFDALVYFCDSCNFVLKCV